MKLQSLGVYQYYMRRGNAFYFRDGDRKLKIILTNTDKLKKSKKTAIKHGSQYDVLAQLF